MSFGLRRTPPRSSCNPINSEEDQDFANVNTRDRRKTFTKPEFAAEGISKESPHSEDEGQFVMLREWRSEIEKTIISTIKSTVQQSISEEMSKLSSSVASLRSDVSKITSNLVSINTSIKDLNTRVSDLEINANFTPDIQTIPKDLQTLKCEYNVQFEHMKSQNMSLLRRLDDMEQYSRQCNIEIRNLTERRNENLVGIIQNIGKILKVNIAETDIASVHRVPHAHKHMDGEKQSPKNVVVKFHSRLLRNNIIAAAHKHKGGISTEMLQLPGTPTKIYVNEHLTLQKKILFRQTKEQCKAKNYKYCWIKNAAVMARKEDNSPVLFIKTELDIIRIK